MDPTEAFIELVQVLEALETAFDEDPKGDLAEELRTEAIGKLKQLQDWLGVLDGAPPKISEIDFEAQEGE